MKNWICKYIVMENPNDVDNLGLMLYLLIVGFLASSALYLFVYVPFLYFWC